MKTSMVLIIRDLVEKSITHAVQNWRIGIRRNGPRTFTTKTPSGELEDRVDVE